MFVFILALLIIWPIAELFVMVQVADWIGFFWMLLLLFLSAVAGFTERRPPAREAFNGVMITAGALLLIIPGFITSALGLILLFPPTRWLLRLVAITLFASKFKVAATSASWGNRGYGYYRSSRRTAYDIDGEAVDVTDRPDGEPLPQLRSGSESGEDQDDRNP